MNPVDLMGAMVGKKKHSILVDVSRAHKSHGLSGVPQEARLMFPGFLESEIMSVAGLIRSYPCNWDQEKLDTLVGQSLFIGRHLSDPIPSFAIIEKLLARLHPRLAGYYRRLFLERKSRYKIYGLKDNLKRDIIWRSFFAPTVPADQRKKVLEADYYLTDWSERRVHTALHSWLPMVRFDTNAFDFVLFQDSIAAKTSSSTQKIIRYHDGIPVLSSDVVDSEYAVRVHTRAIKECAEDSIYVCSSKSSLNDLSRISEKAASRAKVIPCFCPKMTPYIVNYHSLKSICSLRISSTTANARPTQEIIDNWFAHNQDHDAIPKYILVVSSIEPRKNYVGLINSWLKLRYEKGEDIKLIVVGSLGWNFESILSTMQPLVTSGDLLHLERVEQMELSYLYSAASCFVFPSLDEGFGLPPLEAMQCGCPVAISDIPSHRYSAGKAALFFDPYDLDDMMSKMKTLLFNPRDSGLVKDLVNKGYENVKKYSVKNLLSQWENLFDEIVAHRNK